MVMNKKAILPNIQMGKNLHPTNLITPGRITKSSSPPSQLRIRDRTKRPGTKLFGVSLSLSLSLYALQRFALTTLNEIGASPKPIPFGCKLLVRTAGRRKAALQAMCASTSRLRPGRLAATEGEGTKEIAVRGGAAKLKSQRGRSEEPKRILREIHWSPFLIF